jgi:hypothetical protein
MLSLRLFSGKFKQCKEPVWQPLLDVAEEIVDEFMWMEELELETGLRLQFYKHRLTRRPLLLDGEGRAWSFRGNSQYWVAYLSVELRKALDEWWEQEVYEGSQERGETCLAVIERARLADLGEEVP